MADGELADFYGVTFEVEYPLFGYEFEELPGIYIIYTSKDCLEVGFTANLKMCLEEHEHTRDWVRLANELEILVAFHLDEDKESRKDKLVYLKEKMKPLL